MGCIEKIKAAHFKIFYHEVDLEEAVGVLYQPNLPNQITTEQLVAPIRYPGFPEPKALIVAESLGSNLG